MRNFITIKESNYIKNNFEYFKENTMKKEDYLKKIGFSINGNDDYSFNCNVFAKFFLQHIDIVYQSNQENFAIYNQTNGVYELHCLPTVKRIIKFFMNQADDIWQPMYENLAIRSIKTDLNKIVMNFNDGNYINLRNGVLDLDDFKLYKHSPKYLSTIQLPFEYTGQRAMPIFKKYLNDISCGEFYWQMLIQEIMGYCLSNSTAAEKSFFFYGSGCNGKSVLAQIIQKLCGEGNYSNTSLSSLGGNFGLAQLANSNVNISAENNSSRINSEIFKAVVSGDTVEVNRKYKEAISVKLHTKLVLLFNEMPSCDDLSYGFFRKIIIVPFKKKIPTEQIDVSLVSKLENELPAIFGWCIDGLMRLQNNNYQFTDCQASNVAMIEYQHLLNPVSDYFFNNYEPAYNGKIRRSELYSNYMLYCAENGIEAINRQGFWKMLKAALQDTRYGFKISKIRGYEYLKNFTTKTVFRERI